MTLTLFSRIVVGVDGSPLDSSHSITRTVYSIPAGNS